MAHCDPALTATGGHHQTDRGPVQLRPARRLHDLATQAPSDQPDLLARYRSDDLPPLP